MLRNKRKQAEKRQINEENDMYTVEKILDMKKQNGKTYYLVKWLGWDVKTCTWEEQKNVSHLRSLIKDYHSSRKHDRQNNLGLKQLDWVESGMSPYQATKFFGHFLYGDQPKAIKSVQMIEKNNHKEMHFEIEWKARHDHFKPTNSLIEFRTMEEHAPLFLSKFFELKTQLVPTTTKRRSE